MENKTSTYLKYAIGEIVLVVIGILIALSINNWNESRKNDKTLVTYYERLLIDIQNDLKEIETYQNYFRSSIEPIQKEIVNIQSPNYNTDSLYNNIGKWIRFTREFSPNKSTYEDLLSTGNINLIGNQELKTLILDLYTVKYPNFLFFQNRGNRITTDIRITNYLSLLSYLDIFNNDMEQSTDPNFESKRPRRELKWLRHKESVEFLQFENILALTSEITFGNMTRLDKLKLELFSLIKLINSELKVEY
jgi:Family of unknown function (DUF6090)